MAHQLRQQEEDTKREAKPHAGQATPMRLCRAPAGPIKFRQKEEMAEFRATSMRLSMTKPKRQHRAPLSPRRPRRAKEMVERETGLDPVEIIAHRREERKNRLRTQDAQRSAGKEALPDSRKRIQAPQHP